jgi:putative effector of murein hydrolase LrgA (UPF0299 family)
MKMLARPRSTLLGVAVLLALPVLGEGTARALGVPLPGALLGMLVLLGALVALGRVPRGLDAASAPLLRHMMLFFIPAVAGVTLHAARVAREWLPFLAAGIVGAALALAVTALTLRWMLRLTGQGEDA